MSYIPLPTKKVSGQKEVITSNDKTTQRLLSMVLIELRVISNLLAEGLNVKDNLELMRDDENDEATKHEFF